MPSTAPVVEAAPAEATAPAVKITAVEQNWQGLLDSDDEEKVPEVVEAVEAAGDAAAGDKMVE